MEIQSPDTLLEGDPFEVKVKLLDNNNDPLPANTTIIYVQGRTNGTLFTGDDGSILLNRKMQGPEMDFRFTYAGNAEYLPYVAGFTVTLFVEGGVRASSALIAGGSSILIVAALASLLLLMRRRRQETLEELLSRHIYQLENEDNPHAREIYQAVHQVLEAYRLLGRVRTSGTTLREFQVEEDSEAADPLAVLVDIFEEARYSEHKIGAKQVKKALKSFKLLKQLLLAAAQAQES